MIPPVRSVGGPRNGHFCAACWVCHEREEVDAADGCHGWLGRCDCGLPAPGRVSRDVVRAARARAVITRVMGRAARGPAIPHSGAAIPPIANWASPSRAEAVPAVCGGWAESASDAELGRIS